MAGKDEAIRVAFLNLGDSPIRKYLRKKYADRIVQAGAVPVRLGLDITTDPLQQVVNEADAFMFLGGADIDPAMYGEKKEPFCAEQMPARDALEPIFLSMAMATGKPILGICRGLQILNVCLGGTLYQDIPTQIPGAGPHSDFANRYRWTHTVAVEKGSLLAEITGKETLRVNSIHHQSVKDVAKDLRVVARGEDGVIEGAEHTSYPSMLLAVQWHPEHMGGHDPAQQALFERLVAEARAWRTRK